MMMKTTTSNLLTKTTTISNVIERRDSNGDLMDIHDGNLFLDPTNTSRFLWFGMGYTDCDESKGWIPPKDCPGIYETFGKGCGFLENHAVRLYVNKIRERSNPVTHFPNDSTHNNTLRTQVHVSESQ